MGEEREEVFGEQVTLWRRISSKRSPEMTPLRSPIFSLKNRAASSKWIAANLRMVMSDLAPLVQAISRESSPRVFVSDPGRLGGEEEEV